MSDDQKPQAALLLYSIEDVIARTSLGRSKLYELMASGELGSVKVGRRRLIPARALDEFIEGLYANALQPGTLKAAARQARG